MKRTTAAVVAALLLGGCGSEYVVRASTGGPIVAPPPNSIVTGPEGLYVSIGLGAAAANALAWLTGAAIYGAMLMDERGHPGLIPAPMREDRTIVEVDCTQALPPDIVGNIRCR